ncbi:hypothetical protein ACI1MP_37190 (plasmid) [Kitasatospora griseola]|uniref:TRADD-N-associated membrane domain-containing protein n=1 Tax=Kitasatospora griseola TaxID=2064 RepID=UPI003855B483
MCVTLVLCTLFLALYWSGREERERAAREQEILESAADRLREKMELASLVNFNRVLLDKYHGIATEQATKAYRSSRLAMGVGLIILVAAVVTGWNAQGTVDRAMVGAVAAIGTTFTAYLSRTYMQTYERALQQLNQYFNQPVLNGYFLTAERMSEQLPQERRAVVLERIIGDVLESGKEMHRATAAPVPAPRRAPGRRAQPNRPATAPETPAP